MLTLPKIIERDEQPYVAMRERVSHPFGDVVDRVVPELFRLLNERRIAPAGALFIRYRLVAMPHLEIEFGVPTATAFPGDERLITGTLPAGKYASVTYFGSYQDLLDVNAVLIGWAHQKQLRWDMHETSDGDQFGCRLEIYETDPATQPDPAKWKTVVAIRLADEGALQE